MEKGKPHRDGNFKKEAPLSQGHSQETFLSKGFTGAFFFLFLFGVGFFFFLVKLCLDIVKWWCDTMNIRVWWGLSTQNLIFFFFARGYWSQKLDRKIRTFPWKKQNPCCDFVFGVFLCSYDWVFCTLFYLYRVLQ